MGIVEQYFLQLKMEKRRWQCAAAILTALSILVAIGVSWNLRMTGITIANGATCGQEEHQHTEECPMEKVLICGYDNERVTEAPTEMPTEVPAETSTEVPTEEPTEAPIETPTEVPVEAPTEVPTESSAEATVEIQEETVIDLVRNVADDVFSGFILTAHAEELPTEYQTGETVPYHIHTDECYEITWLCDIEEHIHVLACYSDLTADIESAVIWEADLPELTEDWAKDIVQIAQSQLGYGESERNYLVADDGETRNGITRYGQWYGNPYGDWSSMFVLFCLNYAEVPQEAVPWSPGVYMMMRLAEDAEIFQQPEEVLDCSGNLLFLDTDDNGKADRLAIVMAYDEEYETITAICGDWENMVDEIILEAEDSMILGGINIQKVQEVWEAEKESVPEVTTPTDEAPAEPSITLSVEFPEEEEPETFRLTAKISNIEADLYLWQWQTSVDGFGPWTDVEDAYDLVLDLEATEENYNRYYRLVGQRAPVMQIFALDDTETDEGAADLPEEEDTIISEPIAPFSIGKNNNNYTIDVYALPVDANGNRINSIDLTTLSDITVNSTTKISVASKFDNSLGQYQSAYFGTATNVQIDQINSVWRYETGNWWKTYYLAYDTTTGASNTQWKNSADSSISLYMRYIPQFTVTFASEGFNSATETVLYNGTPTLTEPNNWSR